MHAAGPTLVRGKVLFSHPGFFLDKSGRRLTAETVRETPNPIPIQACEIHVTVGCSDSRDVTNAFNQAAKEVRAEYAQQGVYVELVRENVTGTFITPDVFTGLETGIKDRLQQLGELHAHRIPITVFIHILTHGCVTRAPTTDPALKYTLHELQVDPRSSFNCGMRNAENLAQELELELLTEKARFDLLPFGSSRRGATALEIRTPDDVREFMGQAYGTRTLLSAGWVRSITGLPNHALEQKQVLRDLVTGSSTLKALQVKITAGVHNYETHEYFRVDGNTHLDTFLDAVFERKRAILTDAGTADHEFSISPQTPQLGLFHYAYIDEPRATALALHSQEAYRAGTVFAIGSSLAAEFHRRQGPYRIVAFYYGVRHLKLLDWVVLGREPLETQNMSSRITNDPLMNWIIRRYGARLRCYSVSDMTERQKALVSGAQVFETALHYEI